MSSAQVSCLWLKQEAMKTVENKNLKAVADKSC
jgi:hypothetical protein